MNFKEFSEHIIIKEALLNAMDDLDEYETYLENNGWVVIGRGSYGVVFEKKRKNYVLKVYDDMGYNIFLDFLEKNNNNPHLVKIKRKIIKSNNDDTLGIVAIEKLQSIEYSSYKWVGLLVLQFADKLNQSSAAEQPFDTLLDSFRDDFVNTTTNRLRILRRNIKESPHISRYQRDEYIINRRSLGRLNFFIENYLPVAKTLYDLLMYTKVNNLQPYFDLHLGNFMIRPSTNEIVITDPLV